MHKASVEERHINYLTEAIEELMLEVKILYADRANMHEVNVGRIEAIALQGFKIEAELRYLATL